MILLVFSIYHQGLETLFLRVLTRAAAGYAQPELWGSALRAHAGPGV